MKNAAPPFNLVYQIFPDRFSIGGGDTAEAKSARGLYPDDAVIMKWKDAPLTTGRLSFQHYGGDLDGITEKIPYIRSLGADAIYITPIHNAPSYHRYDATDYRSVAGELGGMEAFDRMVCALHEAGIKIIIDLVLNHLSSNHPFFVEALNNPSSPYRDYFYFKENNEYQCWWGNARLPELNLENEAVIQEFVTGEKSVLRFWIDKGIDGFRLDCANDLGVAVSSLVTETARSTKPDVFVIGETFHYGADWLRGLDAIQSYFLTTSVIHLMHHQINGRQFGMNVQTLYDEAQQHGGIHASWNMLSSHDFPRPLTTLEGDHKKLELALLLQFTLPGVPMLYYGDEVGMTGGSDPANRAAMVWDETRWDGKVSGLYKKMLKLRSQRRELVDGGFQDLSAWLDNGVAAYLRVSAADPRDFSIVIVNPTREHKKFPLFIPAAHMFSDMVMRDYFSDAKATSMSGALHIDIKPMQGAMYIPDCHCKEKYTFSKRL